MPDLLETYLTTVGEQIRWKRARPVLLSELRTHLLDQRDTCLDQGMTEEEAQAEAIRQMGDPVAVGQGLDAVHRPKPQWGLLALTLGLALTGTILRVVLTAGWPRGEQDPLRAVLLLLLGSAVLLGAYFLDYSFLGRHGKGLYLAALGLGAVLLLKSPLMGGSGYYLSHIVQVYPLVYAAWLYAWRKTGWKGVLCSLLGLYPLLLVGTQARYLSEVLILAVTGLILLLLLAAWDWFGVGKRGRWAVVLASVLPAAAGTCFLLSREYIRTRLYYAFYPWEDPLGYGFTGVAVQQALDSARWLGPGAWDHSRPYEMTVPEGGADFLLTTVIHKLGWLPFALLLVAFGVLLVWVLVRCLRQQSVLGKLTVLAVVLPLVMQGIGGAVMNLGVSLCTVSFPLLTTGMGMLVDLALLGFALSAFRQERLPRSDRPQTDRSFEILRISRQKGSLTISWQGEKPKHE